MGKILLFAIIMFVGYTIITAFTTETPVVAGAYGTLVLLTREILGEF